MTVETTAPTLRPAGTGGRILVGLGVVYMALAVRLVVETVVALFGDDFLGILGVVLGAGILIVVLQVFVLSALGHLSLGRRFLNGNPDGYPLAIALLVLDVLHFAIYGGLRIGPERDIRWLNAWTDHAASLRRQGIVYLALAAVAVIGLASLVRWIRRAPWLPLPTTDHARTASMQALVVAVMLLTAFVAQEAVQNRRVALRVRDAQAAVDQQIRWRFPVPSSAPLVARGPGRVFLAGDDGELSALDERSGAHMWSAVVSRGVLGIAYGAGTVFVNDLEGVVALNAASGERRWEVGSSGPSTTCVVEPPVADGSAVYVVAAQQGTAVTQLQALEPTTGRERWRHSWRGSTSCGGDRTVAVGNGLVLAPGAGAGDGLTALHATDGETRWETELRGYLDGPPVAVGGSVYAATAGGRFVYALDRDTGSVRWTKDLGFDARGPVAADGDVVIVEDDGVLALDASDGSERWRSTPNEDVLTPAVIDRRLVHVATSLGTYIRLRTFDRQTGSTYACTGLAEPSDEARTVATRDGPMVVSRRTAFALDPQVLSPDTFRTLIRFGVKEHGICPVAEGD